MSTQLTIALVRLHHHRQGIPTHDGAQPLFHVKLAGKRRLHSNGDAVHIRRVALRLPSNTVAASLIEQRIEHEAGARRAFAVDQRA